MSKNRSRNNKFGSSNPLRNNFPSTPTPKIPLPGTASGSPSVSGTSDSETAGGAAVGSAKTTVSPLAEAQKRIAELSEELDLYKLLEAELNDRKAVLAQNESDLMEKENSFSERIRRIGEEEKARAREEILADEARLRQSYRTAQEAEIAELRTNAVEEAEKLREEASIAAQETHKAAKDEAQKVREEAHSHREVLSKQADQLLAQTEQRRIQIIEAAQCQSDALVAQAREDAQRATEEQSARLSTREAELDQKERALARQQRELTQNELDLNEERSDFRAFRAELTERWDKASPERVRRMEMQLADANRLMTAYQEKIAETQTEVERLSQLTSGEDGRSLDVLLEELERTKVRCRELRERQGAMPSDDELEMLRQAGDENTRLRDDNRALQKRCLELEARAQRIDLGNREIHQMQAQVAGLKALHDDMVRELEANSRSLQGRAGKQFEGLANIDAHAEAPRAAKSPLLQTAPDRPDLLERVVGHVRMFAASRKTPLFYSEKTLRTYLAGLAASRLAILQGLSGTGKSSLPRVFGAALDAELRNIPVHSNWRDRHELLGYNNDFTRKFTETDFTKAVYEASLPREQDTPWFIMLDEMNLARIEYYFADFLAELENPKEDARRVPLVPYDPSTDGRGGPKYLDAGSLCLSSNLWFIGTANRDESTFEITDKVYDRAQVLEFNQREAEFQVSRRIDNPARVRSSDLQQAFNQAIGNKDFQITPEAEQYLNRIDRFLQNEVGITFGNRILDQMRRFSAVYVAAGGTLQEATDIQVARKVLRKLEGILDPSLSKTLEALKEEYLRKPSPAGWGRMEDCTAVVDSKLRRMGAMGE